MPATVNVDVTAFGSVVPKALREVCGTVTVSFVNGTYCWRGSNTSVSPPTGSQLPGTAGESVGRGVDLESGSEYRTVIGDCQATEDEPADGTIDETASGAGGGGGVFGWCFDLCPPPVPDWELLAASVPAGWPADR